MRNYLHGGWHVLASSHRLPLTMCCKNPPYSTVLLLAVQLGEQQISSSSSRDSSPTVIFGRLPSLPNVLGPKLDINKLGLFPFFLALICRYHLNMFHHQHQVWIRQSSFITILLTGLCSATFHPRQGNLCSLVYPEQFHLLERKRAWIASVVSKSLQNLVMERTRVLMGLPLYLLNKEEWRPEKSLSRQPRGTTPSLVS